MTFATDPIVIGLVTGSVQVEAGYKAHDVTAFSASKAFQSGVSLEHILSACHWKSHNTSTQFYLKDVAWADTEIFNLGPAAQQVHHQTPK